MVDIQPYASPEDVFDDGRPWLVAVERKMNESITLDVTAIKANADLLTDDGQFIRSGIALVRNEGTGLYGPGTAALAEVDGHLFTAEKISATQTRASAALMTHGTITRSLIPGGVAADAVLPALIRYV